jgi:hypothetical protein
MASPLSRATCQAASTISRRVAERRSVCLSRFGLPNMVRIFPGSAGGVKLRVIVWLERRAAGDFSHPQPVLIAGP